MTNTFQAREARRPVSITRARAKAPFVCRLWREDSAETLVEFALTAFVFLLLLFGVIQTCLALYTYNYVSDAARMATRYASVRGSSCTGMPDCGITQAEILTYLRGMPYPGIRTGSLSVTATWLRASSSPGTTWTACGTPCESPGNAVQVQVSYPVAIFVPRWGGSTLTVRSTSQIVISN